MSSLSLMPIQSRMEQLNAEYHQLRRALVALNGQANVMALQDEIMRRMNQLCNEILCEDNPELRNRVCPLCQGVFNGYGNNGAPLIQAKVCDECNRSRVIPARMEQDSDDEYSDDDEED